MDHDHNHIRTRDQLKGYDPGLAEFCEKVMGDGEWRFVSPRERAGEGRLKDYDPAKAPVVVRADFIETAALDYYDEYWSGYWQRLYDKHGIESPVAESNPHSRANGGQSCGRKCGSDTGEE